MIFYIFDLTLTEPSAGSQRAQRLSSWWSLSMANLLPLSIQYDIENISNGVGQKKKRIGSKPLREFYLPHQNLNVC